MSVSADHARAACDPLLPQWLRARLAQPLPGPVAQCQFEPELSFGRHYGPPPSHARRAAVLVLLYPSELGWCLPLTVRPDTMADHAGQVSFPGGSMELDEPSEDAALRELHEELGVSRDGIELLGQLSSLYVFASNFHVVPWLAACRMAPCWSIASGEVAEVLEPTLSDLLDRANWGSHRRRVRGLEFAAPHLVQGNHHIWGATSMILAELLALVEQRAEELAATNLAAE